MEVGKTITQNNWKLQQEAGIDLIPCNDFSYYDQVLDMTLTVGAIPERYQEIALKNLNWMFILPWQEVSRKTALILPQWK